MGELAGISGKTAVAKFVRFGYRVVRQKGSHVRLRHVDARSRLPITIPLHKELKIGLLVAAVKDAGMTTEQFLAL